jgi:hypothetical protein
MAHFAEIDKNKTVLRVLVVDDNDTGGGDLAQESIGIEYLKSALGSDWLQTSYNRNFRKNYAARGYEYDEERNAFILPCNYASWVLNEATCVWEPPIPYPDVEKHYVWDEDTLSWIEITE